MKAHVPAIVTTIALTATSCLVGDLVGGPELSDSRSLECVADAVAPTRDQQLADMHNALMSSPAFDQDSIASGIAADFPDRDLPRDWFAEENAEDAFGLTVEGLGPETECILRGISKTALVKSSGILKGAATCAVAAAFTLVGEGICMSAAVVGTAGTIASILSGGIAYLVCKDRRGKDGWRGVPVASRPIDDIAICPAEIIEIKARIQEIKCDRVSAEDLDRCSADATALSPADLEATIGRLKDCAHARRDVAGCLATGPTKEGQIRAAQNLDTLGGQCFQNLERACTGKAGKLGDNPACNCVDDAVDTEVGEYGCHRFEWSGDTFSNRGTMYYNQRVVSTVSGESLMYSTTAEQNRLDISNMSGADCSETMRGAILRDREATTITGESFGGVVELCAYTAKAAACVGGMIESLTIIEQEDGVVFDNIGSDGTPGGSADPNYYLDLSNTIAGFGEFGEPSTPLPPGAQFPTIDLGPIWDAISGGCSGIASFFGGLFGGKGSGCPSEN